MSAALLALEDVGCFRGGRILFEGLSLALRPGQAAIVTGPNGVGKSSLLRICAGLLAPLSGHVARNASAALASEALALDEELPLARALHFWARLDGKGTDEVGSALAAMGIAALADVPVRLLSTGQRRRGAIARLIAGGAPIWLLDEPANGLDAAALDALAMVLAGHRASGGVVLAASHQPLGLDEARTVEL
ncbi:MAG TPA: heme ABC exporter ATP-binding protein CcmA [Sphingomonas sp.]|nr:heme ABC exporter ATP-binding protein CcmA [Sphingomonas sp.]